MLALGLLTACGVVRKNFGRIPKGPKSADFEPKAWAVAMVLKMVDFGKCGKITGFRSSDPVDIFKGKPSERPKSTYSGQNIWAVAHRFAWRNEWLWVFCFRAVRHDLLLTVRARGELGTWPWWPLPAQPRVKVRGECLSPWLVEFARARTVMIDGAFAFLYQKRTGLMFWLPVFGVNCCFFRWSPFVFNTLELSQGGMPPSVMSEGDYGEVFEQRLVFVLPDWKVHRLPQPRTNAGKWWSQS